MRNIVKQVFNIGGLFIAISVSAQSQTAKNNIVQRYYTADSVVFFNKTDSIKIGATLTIPVGKKKYPAVVLVSGTGKQDRDGTMAGHKLFAQIADHLSNNGIAVLRMDDRGVGQTTGIYDSATTANFAKDALAAINYLKSRPEINSKKIGLLGHSEGGMAIAIAASQSNSVAFLVSLAGLCMNGYDALIVQNRDLVMSSPLSDVDKKRSNAINELMFQTALANADSLNMADKLNETYNKWKAEDDAYFKTLNIQFDHFRFPIYSYVRQATSPWYRYFIKYNAVKTLSRVNIPILAINGEKDVMVAYQPNLENWKKLPNRGRNKDVTTEAIPNVNHLLLPCTKCTPQEYREIKEEISPEMLSTINDWIRKRFD